MNNDNPLNIYHLLFAKPAVQAGEFAVLSKLAILGGTRGFDKVAGKHCSCSAPYDQPQVAQLSADPPETHQPFPGRNGISHGLSEWAKVCRYERFAREPNLWAAFAYEVIFNTSASELFAGIFEQVERDVAARSALVIRRLRKAGQNLQNTRKLTLLKLISDSVKPKKQKNQ